MNTRGSINGWPHDTAGGGEVQRRLYAGGDDDAETTAPAADPASDARVKGAVVAWTNLEMWNQSPLKLKGALGGGAVVALVAAVLTFVVGRVGGIRAEALLEASLPTIQFLCSSAMTASATTLALLLTLLSLSASSDRKLKPAFYRSIQKVALLSVVAFIGASVLLLTLAVPFGDEVRVPTNWYVVLYYATTLVAASVVGVLVAVLLALYHIVGDLISTFWLDGPASPLAEEEEQAEAEEGER